jgi:hypothetical protein
VPPAVLGLSIALVCPHLRYGHSTVALRIAHTAGRGRSRLVVLTAHVVGRGRGRPLGTVTFRANGRRVGQGVVDPRTGTVTLGVFVRGRMRFTAAYSGDGTYAPSRS